MGYCSLFVGTDFPGVGTSRLRFDLQYTYTGKIAARHPKVPPYNSKIDLTWSKTLLIDGTRHPTPYREGYVPR